MINRLGGLYYNGRALPLETRQQIIQLYSQGCRPCDISRFTKISHGCISKILKRYKTTGTIEPGPIPNSQMQNVSKCNFPHTNMASNLPSKRERRARTIFTTTQKTILESAFAINQYANRKMINDLVRSTGLSENCIRVWFSNKRSNVRKYQNRGEHSETSMFSWNYNLLNEKKLGNYFLNQYRTYQTYAEYLQPSDEQPQNSESATGYIHHHPQSTTSNIESHFREPELCYPQSQLPMETINRTQHSHNALQTTSIPNLWSEDQITVEFQREALILEQQHSSYTSQYGLPKRNHYWTQISPNETFSNFDYY